MADYSEKELTVRQAAAALSCSERTVLNYLTQGKLKGRKQGKRWVVEAETVAARRWRARLNRLLCPRSLRSLSERSQPFRSRQATFPKPRSLSFPTSTAGSGPTGTWRPLTRSSRT